jgi:hypothetical protein
MASKGAGSDEQTVRYLLSVIKSCADFQPNFTQVAEEFNINTSRPGTDALVASRFISEALFFTLLAFSSLHYPPSPIRSSFPVPKDLQHASSHCIRSGPVQVCLLHYEECRYEYRLEKGRGRMGL